ncbi:hypothetical protein Patl1_35019 [Pistacia atlantica]|uniref:Uncharacterized protein n=1 Tax=Pistacia atlantica TaxID=434234 RepID=A0ACC0ZPV6_9ROSI|nr:hypothetical protein Patl1_35019 [Pistacia atlantica]
MKNNNKDYKLSKLLTREVSMSNSSKDQDNYHGEVSVSIPFTWESQPGTPKIRFRENPLPPLTPPPSYFYNSPKTSMKKSKPNKSNPLGTILPKRVRRKTSSSSSSNSSASFSRSLSSPWSGSYSVPSSPIGPSVNFRGRCEVSRPRLSFDSRAVGEEEKYESQVSTLCFARVANSRSKSGCYSSIIKVLFRNS